MIVFIWLHITLPHFHLKVLNFWNACQVHSVVCVSNIESVLSVISTCNIWGCVYSAYLFLLWWLSEYVHLLLLLSSNRIRTFYLIIITKSEAWPIYNCLGHETMVCVVCLCILFLSISCCPISKKMFNFFECFGGFTPFLVRDFTS